MCVVFYIIFPLSFSLLNVVLLLFVCAQMMTSPCKPLVIVGIKRMISKMIMQLLIKWCWIPGDSFMHQVSNICFIHFKMLVHIITIMDSFSTNFSLFVSAIHAPHEQNTQWMMKNASRNAHCPLQSYDLVLVIK